MVYKSQACHYFSIQNTMTPNQLTQMICLMESRGGSFVSALALALRYADPSNRARLLDAFPDIVKKYGPDSTFTKAETMTKDLVIQ